MSDKMEVSSAETGIVRVFHLDLPPEAIERFTAQAGTGEWPLQYALGANTLRAAHVEVVDLRDLGAMSLSAYLAEAYDLSGSGFKQSRAQLDALKGHVVIATSSAFGGTAQSLRVATPLRWVGSFSEEKRPASLTRLRAKSARGALSPEGDAAEPAPRRSAGRNLWISLGALFVGVVVLFFLVG